ncbi:MAG: divergent polysaccharide deacetylase family protein [Alphaproteobacteria bacterium]|nr:divergent polysaccharide deacetylase family protein [Alphaproteobacteria bacterium]
MRIRKKKLSLSIGFASLALICLWVGIILVGISSESDKIRIKEFNGQKVTYLMADIRDEDQINKQKKSIYLVIDDSKGELQIDKIINQVPREATFGISPYNKSIHKNIAVLMEGERNFLVNIPLSTKKNIKNKFDIYSGSDTIEISNRIENIYNMTQGNIGFYNLGNDDFLEQDNALEATVKKIYDLESAFFYGIKDKTSTLELEEGSSFKVKAFDIEVNDSDVEKGLKRLEELAIEKGEAVGILKINNDRFDIVDNWNKSLKAKNVEIVSAKSIFRIGANDG